MIFKQKLPQTRVLLFTLFGLVILSFLYILIGWFLRWPFFDFVLALFSSLVVATATVFDSNINRSEALIAAEVSKIDEYNSLIDALFMRLSLIRGEYQSIYDAIETNKNISTRSFLALFLHHSYYTRTVASIEISRFGYLPTYLDLADESCGNLRERRSENNSIYLELHSLIYDVNLVLDFIVIIDQLTEKLRNQIVNDGDDLYIENNTMEQLIENSRFSTCVEEILRRVPTLEKRLVDMINCLSDSAHIVFSQLALQRRCIINPLEHMAKLGDYQYCNAISPSSDDLNEELLKRLTEARINL